MLSLKVHYYEGKNSKLNPQIWTEEIGDVINQMYSKYKNEEWTFS
jgi:hypothetical protein